MSVGNSYDYKKREKARLNKLAGRALYPRFRDRILAYYRNTRFFGGEAASDQRRA